jgi:chromosome segregation ATPase
MSDSEQGTPVGQIPVTGGRERLYANDAERARAWRERQKARRREAIEGGGGDVVTPVLAEANLSVLLDRLAEVGRAHEATVGELAGRVEDAISALADPEAVAEALEGARVEAARQVAEAEERAVRASQAKAAAEAAARAAALARTEAEEAANAAWERTEALEAELSTLRRDLEVARDDAIEQGHRHGEELETLRAGHAEQLNEQKQTADRNLAEVRRTAQEAVAEANAGRDRAEGTASELRAELETVKQSADAALAAARAEAVTARTELAEQLAGRYQAELAAAQAKADIEITRAQVRSESVQELAENRANEVSRLVAQVDDLRADLRRAREGGNGHD